jgi:dTDP-glucose 4,6-dehydratase
MADILVAGGAGFIGSHISERLLDRGDRVICVDNFLTGRIENIEKLNKNEKFNFIEKDICENLDFDFSVDYVFNFASPASPRDFGELSIEILETGSTGTDNLLKVAGNNNAKYLFASSSEVYGDAEVHPQTEKYWGNVNPVGYRSPYDESKRFSESLVMAYHRRYELDVYIARLFNTYGPRMRLDDGRVVPNFIKQALTDNALTIYGDGKQTRALCYIDDMVEGLLRLINTDYHQPINLGNPQEITMIELAELICELVGIKPSFEYLTLPEDDPTRRNPDITKAKEIMNWEPEVSLKDGLKETIEYFKILLANKN